MEQRTLAIMLRELLHTGCTVGFKSDTQHEHVIFDNLQWVEIRFIQPDRTHTSRQVPASDAEHEIARLLAGAVKIFVRNYYMMSFEEQNKQNERWRMRELVRDGTSAPWPTEWVTV